jgi:ABC-2 type transport system ATP-binding protein
MFWKEKVKMQTNIGKNSGAELILEVKDMTKYYIGQNEEDNIISIVGFLEKNEDLGIKGVSLDIYKGRSIGLVGNKKYGNSTLLKLISGVIKPSSGTVLYKGLKVNDLQLKELVSYVSKEQPSSQEYNCTMLENLIQYVCRNTNNRCNVVVKAEKLIEDFGLEDYKFKQVIKLPSAVRSKMFIIRGFLSYKPIICFDQPLTFIGEDQLKTFKKYLDELVQKGRTIIISSDEENIIKSICDETITI